MSIDVNKIHLVNAIHILPLIKPKSVNTCVSSPPYYALRDYGLEPTKWPAMEYTLFGFKIKVKAMTCCLGLEPTPQDFIGHLVYIYWLVRETLTDDGTAWVNMGDSYSAHKKARTAEQAARKSNLKGSKEGQISCANQQSKLFKDIGIKPKDMLGIPWMLAFALREDGWYLRQDIIWHKRNCMPESATDRCTKNHEYIFLLSKNRKYFFDNEAIKTVVKPSTTERMKQDITNQLGSSRAGGGAKHNGNMKSTVGTYRHLPGNWSNSEYFSGDDSFFDDGRQPRPGVDTRGGNQGRGSIPAISKAQTFKRDKSHHTEPIPGQGAVQHRPDRKDTEVTGFANKRSVWSIATQGFSEAHFATFPKKLIIDCIKAETSEHGHCKDCGKPYYRVTNNTLIPGPKASFNSQVDQRDIDADKQDAGSNRIKDGHKPGWINTSETTNWLKSCKCKTDERKPGVVLDMFSGSGTTFIVAKELGRDAIACEQSAKYLAISDRRRRKELGIFNPTV